MTTPAAVARSSAVPAALTIASVAALLVPGGTQRYAALLFAALTGLALLLVRERAVFTVTAFVLAGMPLIPAPGLGAPLILVLGIAVWVGLFASSSARIRLGWVEALVVLTVVSAAVSVLVTGVSGESIVEWGRWVIAFTLVVPLRMIGEDELVAFGRWFVLGGCFGAAFGLALFVLDRQGLLLKRLSAFGYDDAGGNLRLVQGSESSSLRLTGTYVDPNMGALVLVVALILAVALFRGLPRIAASGLLGIAILLTLSRASIATVALVVLVLVVAGRLARGPRILLSAVGVAGVVTVLSIPVVRQRLFDSFGPTDAGTQARWAALADFNDSMSDHWWFGLGWGIEAFRDPVAAQAVNYVANTPLLTVYRSGLIVGVIFVVLLLGALIRSVSLLRLGSFPQAVVGAGLLAMCVVALQLDFAVALLPPATMSFGVLLAFATHPRWQSRVPDAAVTR